MGHVIISIGYTYSGNAVGVTTVNQGGSLGAVCSVGSDHLGANTRGDSTSCGNEGSEETHLDVEEWKNSKNVELEQLELKEL